MKISREKPCQRRHHRVKTPLNIRIHGINYEVVDWGLGGFRIAGWQRDDLQPGDSFEFYFKLPFQGFYIAFNGQAKLVRTDQREEIAATFYDLSERQQELLSHFVEELIRGSMTPVSDTILRIDSPVTPVSTEPDPSPTEEIPVQRWPKKMILMGALYFSLGLALFTYIVFTLYANFLSLEVESGVVAAPIERILSTTDGRIQHVAVLPDELVTPGTALIQVEDARVEEQISLAQIRIERDRATLEMRREELVLEQEKLIDYRGFAEKSLTEARIRVSSLTTQEQLAKKDVRRYQDLLHSGAVSKKQMEEALRLRTVLSGDLEIALITLQKQQSTLAVLKDGRFFTGERFEGRVKEIKSEVNRLKQAVTHTTQELLALYQRRERLTVHASTHGRIVQLVKTAGSSTKRGETIALFERNEQRVIEAYLTQNEVLDIKMHHPARLYFPSLDQVADGQVIAIDRTEGFLNEKESRYSWRASEDRTAKVTLSFIGLNTEKIRQQFEPGLPVMVVFPHLAVGIFGKFIRSFKSHTKQLEIYEHTEAPMINYNGGKHNAIAL